MAKHLIIVPKLHQQSIGNVHSNKVFLTQISFGKVHFKYFKNVILAFFLMRFNGFSVIQHWILEYHFRRSNCHIKQAIISWYCIHFFKSLIMNLIIFLFTVKVFELFLKMSFYIKYRNFQSRVTWQMLTYRKNSMEHSLA